MPSRTLVRLDLMESRVPLYFFHVHDGQYDHDDEGTELTGPDEARAQALATAGEMLKDKSSQEWLGERWMMAAIQSANSTLRQGSG